MVEQNLNPEYKSFQISDRGLDDYLIELELDLEEIKGRVLDVGSGRIERFGRDLMRNGAEVICLSNALGDKRTRENRSTIMNNLRLEEYGLSVGGDASNLPFRDCSFDTVIALYSVPEYSNDELISSQIAEIARVLNDGGNAYIYPIRKDRLGFMINVLNIVEVNYQFRQSSETLNAFRLSMSK